MRKLHRLIKLISRKKELLGQKEAKRKPVEAR